MREPFVGRRVWPQGTDVVSQQEELMAQGLSPAKTMQN